MGKCVLNFDQMEIQNKKSDTSHSDNDWMIIYWFVNGKLVRTDRFPLYNTAGSVILDSGNAITPFASEVGCADNELVTATFQVINLGSSPFSKQAEAAEKFAEQAAKDIAEAYVKAAEFVVRNSGIPLSAVYADGIHAVAPAIVSTVGFAFEDAIIPLLNHIVDTVLGLLGKPNCNGDVLHDTAVFLPDQPSDLTISKPPYIASSVTFCGDPAKTSLQLTLQRIVDPPPSFSSQPPPDVGMVAAKNEPLETWLGTWAEDTTPTSTPTPKILVTIARSTAASGLLEVTVTEHVDSRFDAKFEASNNTLSPHNKTVFIFTDDVFAHIRPWTSLPVRPVGLYLQFPQIRTTGTHAIDIRSTEEAQTSLPTFRLLWNRPLQVGGGVPISSLLKGSAEKSHLSPAEPHFLEQVEVLEIVNQGVTLCLYRLLARNTVIGHNIRYIRDENLSFTRADVMLGLWSPLH
jgi:hypothetical protein